MMFVAKHNNPSFLLNYFKSIEEITDLLPLHIDKDGLYIKTMDNSHISFVDSFISSDNFEIYNFNSLQAIFIGINLKYLTKILSVLEKGDNLIFKLIEKSNTIEIIFENKNRKSVYNLKLIDIDCDSLDVPSMDYDQEIEMSFIRLDRVCKEISIVASETIKFIIDSENKNVSILGDGELGNIRLDLKEYEREINKKFIVKKEDGKVIINKKQIEYKVYPSKNSFESEFDIKKICNILKMGSICNSLLINLSEDSPLKFEFDLENDSYLHYYVAPKIQDF